MAISPNINDRQKDSFLQTSDDKTARRVVAVDADGNPLTVNDDGQLHVVLRGSVCENCSTSTPLAAGATFTGTASDMLDFGIIFVTVYSDVDSATDGLSLEQSSDGTNWDVTDTYTVTGTHGKIFSIQPAAKYFRVVYTNGSSDQTVLRLQTVLKKTNSLPSSHRIQDSIVDDDDAQLIKAIISGKNPAGTFVNFTSTTAGNFKVSLEELENDISVNSNEQLKVTQFDSSGNEGQKIIGIDYLAGNSGIDAATETLQVIEYEHHEIHSGSHFDYCDYQRGNAVSATIEFVLTTPDTAKWIHFVFDAYSSAGATLEVYRGPTGVVGGTVITPRNNNENSDTVSVVTLVKDPASIADDGIRSSGYLVGGTRSPGSEQRDREIILKQNTAYLLRITSLANSNDISWCAEWYEHTNKN